MLVELHNHCALAWEGNQQDASQETCQIQNQYFEDFREKGRQSDEKTSTIIFRFKRAASNGTT